MKSKTKAKENTNYEDRFIHLNDGESIRVRLLSDEDFIEWVAHSTIVHNSEDTPCISPMGLDCPLCKASKAGGED